MITADRIDDIDSLLDLESKDELDELFRRANKVKEENFGNKISLFAPLYLSNECINNCLYCGFRSANKALRRKTLNTNDILKQAVLIEGLGFRKILLVSSENDKIYDAAAIAGISEGIYSKTKIKDIGVNIAPQDMRGFEILKESSVNLYQSFQETYHEQTYRMMHPSFCSAAVKKAMRPLHEKSDFQWRLDTMDRAARAGIKNIGMGVLLGLYDWKFEVSRLVEHTRQLLSKFDLSISVSVPRLRPALGAPMQDPAYPLSELELKKIIAVLRITLPYSHITVSTRESSNFRNEALFIGASQLSAASRTSPGGYDKKKPEHDSSQFSIEDMRTLKEIKEYLLSAGLEPA